MPDPARGLLLICTVFTGIVVAFSAARTAAATCSAVGPEPPVIIPVYSVPVGP